jgi:RAP1 GTPase activating protein 1
MTLVDVTGTDFRTETKIQTAKISPISESLLQECEKDIIWYRDNFFGKGTFSWNILIDI